MYQRTVPNSIRESQSISQMNIPLILRTVIHLKPTQIVFQIKNRLKKADYKEFECGKNVGGCQFVPFIPKYKCYDNGVFSFLNISSPFVSWNDTENGMLWAYNLNYMDWLQQEGIDYTEASQWIDKFIEELPHNRIGLDPYPIALRSINWIKFISQHNAGSEQLKKWNDSLYSQVRLLEKKLEYHLLGNHLLEDSYAWFISSIYFNDKRMFSKASKLLLKELKEQILADGSHYEQSPMYHCILLDRLLDCYNFSFSNNRFGDIQAKTDTRLRNVAEKMLGHLQSLVYSDGSIPLLNDSAIGIAPTPQQIFDYAKRLKLDWRPIKMKECGYRKYSNTEMETIIDAGNITASYQPGHSHADTFNYELRIDGKPFIIDTGISTYDKTPRRQLERSTKAHNTVTIDNRDSNEVWGGFRVGKRAKVTIIKETEKSIKASHNGFGKSAIHTRCFRLENGQLSISDNVEGHHDCKNYLHFAPGTEIISADKGCITTNTAKINIEGAETVEITDGKISTEYNRFLPVKIAIMHFKHEMKYIITTI